MAHHAPSFNSAQAADLFPQLVNLAQLSSLHDPTAEDPEARTAKLEVGKQASHLRSTLATLKAEAQTLPAGNMSLDDQAWLITRLEEQLEGKKKELSQLVELIPAEQKLQATSETLAMEMD